MHWRTRGLANERVASEWLQASGLRAGALALRQRGAPITSICLYDGGAFLADVRRLLERVAHLQHAQIVVMAADDLYTNW